MGTGVCCVGAAVWAHLSWPQIHVVPVENRKALSSRLAHCALWRLCLLPAAALEAAAVAAGVEGCACGLPICSQSDSGGGGFSNLPGSPHFCCSRFWLALRSLPLAASSPISTDASTVRDWQAYESCLLKSALAAQCLSREESHLATRGASR